MTDRGPATPVAPRQRRRADLFVLSAAVLLSGLPGCGGGDADDPVDGGGPSGLCAEVPEGRVSLPADDAPHPEVPLEWWYWTGHLQTQDGRRLGFEWSFFSGELDGAGRGQMVHHALTDVEAGTFVYDVAFAVGAPDPTVDGFDLAVGTQRATGGGGLDALHGQTDATTLELELRAEKAPVLQHGDGYTEYEYGGYTYYYSRERMAVTGVLREGDEVVEVEGTGWFDHQWGEMQTAVEDGWDWFALQLDDEREIMLFEVRAESGPVLVGGSLSGADCAQVELAAEDVEIVPTGEWTSPGTGCTWPSGWEVRVGDLDLVVTPVLEDQELVNPVVTYWEGAADVTGDATGRAYVELTGYCP